MRYQVDFLLPLKLQKISYYFGLCWKILLVNQFAGFFTFDLFDLLILIPRDHCDIVLLFWHVWRFQGKCPNIFDRYPLHVQQFLHNCNFSKCFPMILCNKNMTAKVCTFLQKSPLQMSTCYLLQKNIISWPGRVEIIFFTHSFKIKGLQVMDFKAFTKLPLLYFWRKKKWDKFLTAHF